MERLLNRTQLWAAPAAGSVERASKTPIRHRGDDSLAHQILLAAFREVKSRRPDLIEDRAGIVANLFLATKTIREKRHDEPGETIVNLSFRAKKK